MRKKEENEGFPEITHEMVLDTVKVMIKMAELSVIIEDYLNSDKKEEKMLKIQEKIKTFDNFKRKTLDLILNIPDENRSLQLLLRYTKSFRSTESVKEGYEIYSILSREYPNDMLLKQHVRDLELLMGR